MDLRTNIQKNKYLEEIGLHAQNILGSIVNIIGGTYTIV